MSNQKQRNRQPAGVPVGGEYAKESGASTGLSLALADAETLLGAERETISMAQARRELPVGTPVQVLYLDSDLDRRLDLRTVTKQNASSMETTRTGDEAGSPVYLAWGSKVVERDPSGVLFLKDQDGTPFVAYVPLADGREPLDPATPIDPELLSFANEARRCQDPARLAEIADRPIMLERRYVAENPFTDTDTLNALAQDEHPEVRRVAARNPHTPTQTLDRLSLDDTPAGSRTPSVAYSVASHPNAGPAALTRLSESPDEVVRWAVARHPSTPVAVLERMGTDADSGLVESLARNASTPAHLLEKWSGHEPNVARNPSTPPHALEAMARQDSSGNNVRAWVAANPSAPSAVVERLVREGDPWVSQHAAQNPNLTRPAMDLLLAGAGRTRRVLAGNANLSAGHVSALAADSDPFVRSDLAKNPALTATQLHFLAGDDFHAVRASVASNPTTPVQVLAVLASDAAENVRFTAEDALANRSSR